MGLKEIYYSLEDKYYAFLDKIQNHIPIYSIVDPIDKVFPSFILLIIVVLLLIGGGIAFFLLNLEPAQHLAYIKVVNDQNTGLQNVSVLLKIGEQPKTLTTNSNGTASVLLETESAQALVSINAAGFKKITDKSVGLQAGKTEIIQLEADVASFETSYVVDILDSTTNTAIDDVTIVVTFVCQYTTTAPGQKFVTSGHFVVNAEASCGTLYASFTPNSKYEERRNVAILESPQEVTLNPLEAEPEKGSIEVTVLDSNSHAVANAQIQYWSSLNTNNPSSVGSTDAQGKKRIENIEVGTYGVSAYVSADGRRKQETGIEVLKDDTTSVILSLPAVTNSRRIFVKIVDSNTLEPLGGVTVRLYDNTAKLGDNGTTSNQGIFERVVDKKATSNFSAVFSHASYLYKAMELIDVNAGTTEPTQIALQKALRNADGTPLNYGIGVVKTMDEEGGKVQDAQVEFYQSDYPNPLVLTQTGSDANVAIYNLAPTGGSRTYRAKAYSQENDANGVSDSRTLAAGETKEFPVVLYTGTGTFEITIVDYANPTLKIAGAKISAYSWNPVTETKTVLDQGQTDSTGVWKSNPIKANQSVRFDVNATGKKRFTSGLYTFSRRDQVIKETFKLSTLTTFPGDACQNNNQCSFPQECASGACELECSENADCAGLGNYYCNPEQLCELVPQNYCDESTACPASCNACINNQCAEPIGQSCSSNSNCCGMVCDLVSSPSVCYNPNGDSCTVDADCGGNGFSCADCGMDALGEPTKCCRNACTYPNHSECPAGMVCDASNYCTPINPARQIQLVFEEIRNEDRSIPLTLLQGKTYIAIFRLQLSGNGNWQNVEMHYRMGPDSDANGSDQNIFVLNIDSIPGQEVAEYYPAYSSKTDLSSIYSSPVPVNGESESARQVNMKYETLDSQSDFLVAVKFKTKSTLKLGTLVPIYFQGRGTHNGYVFNTESHTKALAIGDALCTTNCPPFIWTFHLNSDTGPLIKPSVSTTISENSDYRVYYALLNTTTTNYLDASLEGTTDTPIMDINQSVAFSGQIIPSQSQFNFGLITPFLFSTNTTDIGSVGHLNFELLISGVDHDSMEQELAFAIEPQISLMLSFFPIGNNRFLGRVQAENAEGTRVNISDALVRVKTHYAGNDWQDPSSSLEPWQFSCTTNNVGACYVDGLTFENAGSSVIVEARKNNYKTTRIRATIGEPTPTFGDVIACLRFKFENQSSPEPMFYKVQRPSEQAISITSDCNDSYNIAVETLPFDAIEGDVHIEELGTIDDPVPIAKGEKVEGNLVIEEESPLGFIPVIIKVEHNGLWISGFIAGRAVVWEPTEENRRFEIADSLIMGDGSGETDDTDDDSDDDTDDTDDTDDDADDTDDDSGDDS